MSSRQSPHLQAFAIFVKSSVLTAPHTYSRRMADLSRSTAALIWQDVPTKTLQRAFINLWKNCNMSHVDKDQKYLRPLIANALKELYPPGVPMETDYRGWYPRDWMPEEPYCSLHKRRRLDAEACATYALCLARCVFDYRHLLAAYVDYLQSEIQHNEKDIQQLEEMAKAPLVTADRFTVEDAIFQLKEHTDKLQTGITDSMDLASVSLHASEQCIVCHLSFFDSERDGRYQWQRFDHLADVLPGGFRHYTVGMAGGPHAAVIYCAGCRRPLYHQGCVSSNICEKCPHCGSEKLEALPVPERKACLTRVKQTGRGIHITAYTHDDAS